MKARRLIDGAAYGPATVKAMGEAFDRAWAEIEPNFTGPAQIEAARVRLAEAMLSITVEGAHDVEALKDGALVAFDMDYRSGIRSPEKSC